MLCQGNHLLRDCPGIPKVLEVWSNGCSPLLLASGIQDGGTSSAGVGKAPKIQGKLTNPCKLCEGHHAIHLCPYMDETKRILDNSIVSTPCLPAGYKKISLSPPPTDPMIDQESSLVNPAPPEIQIQESVPDHHWMWNWLTWSRLWFIRSFSLKVDLIPLMFFLFLQIPQTWQNILLSL